MQNLKDFELLLNSSVPIIVVERHEETRLIELFNRIINNLAKTLFLWTVTGVCKAIELLNQIKMTKHEGIYLLVDFHPFLDDPVHVPCLL